MCFALLVLLVVIPQSREYKADEYKTDVWSAIGSLFITASLAEMSSMWVLKIVCLNKADNDLFRTPSSAGQYFWVSEFASKRWQKSLSYITGKQVYHNAFWDGNLLLWPAWMTVIGWQCGNASGIFLTGSMIQSIITIYRPANGTMIWQTIVFLIPCLALVILTNIYSGRAIAITQNVMMSIHILALIAIIGTSSSYIPHSHWYWLKDKQYSEFCRHTFQQRGRF